MQSTLPRDKTLVQLKALMDNYAHPIPATNFKSNSAHPSLGSKVKFFGIDAKWTNFWYIAKRVTT